MGIEAALLIPFTLKFNSLDKAGRSIYYYIVSSIIFAVGADVIEYLSVGGNNMWFFAIMYFVQFLILSYFYHIVIKNKKIKTVIKILPIPVLIVFILDLFHIEGFENYNSLFTTLRSFILLIYAIIYFLQLLNDNELIENAIFINSLPNFWYNAGLFIFLCSSFLFSLSYNYLAAHGPVPPATLCITFIGGILEMILFYIGLLKITKQRK
ncbi:hypothetical protein DVR12_26005 [Chitinophaga silvatica]|uniref:YhhN-like protein n=2 Tax=Chitinophaga silvatica TaxID=2282649 RepID=A0A3E1Y2D2_9BACT|nr:hypothetical protein DVR12_26005 [Chitinophaga silvatica]